jgi:hypothetical protein
MPAQHDEGTLDPWAAQWLKENPQPNWMSEGFPPEIRELPRSPVGPPPTRHIDQVDELVDGVTVRIYRGNGPQTGLVVYFHVGAFVIGSIGIMDKNDQAALGVLRALHERGRSVPEDVSVVGFDDMPESGYFLPPLTTIRQDFGEVGRRCVQLLLAHLDEESIEHRHASIPAEQIVRWSSAKPA